MLGIIMFVIALVIQIGYTVFCIVTKSKQDRVKHILRFTLSGVFILLIFLFGHGWSFQWTALSITLAVLLLVSFVQIIFSKKFGKKNKPFYKWRIILASIGSILLLFIGLLPAIIFPSYRHPVVTGEYEVNYETHSYVDDTRKESYSNAGENREVNVAFWYPKDTKETYPLVVFSHGFSGIKNSNESAYIELASHGYVVCSIDHPYHSFYTVNENQKVTLIDRAYMDEYANLAKSGKEERLDTFQKWMDVRVGDINFVIDTIINSQGGIYQLVDSSKIGVFGHSLGGAAAMGVPRVRKDIGAVVNIDAPMMCEFTGVENDWYTINETSYPAPLLNIYSEYLYENGIQKDDEEYFENRLISATAPASFEVVFTGTQHMSLTDLTLFSPVLANMLDEGRKADVDKYKCLETMNNIILQFFDCYLKGKGTFTAAGIY